MRESPTLKPASLNSAGAEETADPIGIFDSGVGGLSVLRALRRALPGREILYIGDTANVPYGDKPLSVVRDLALALTEWLAVRGCRTVVMASGTSTAAGLDCAREIFPNLGIHGTVESGARAALAVSKGTIGVVATNATVASLAFTHAIQRIDPGRAVVEQGCPRFVPLVESGRSSSAEARDAAAEYLPPLLAAGADTVILGCTHFPFLIDALSGAANATSADRPPVFVDPAVELAAAIASSSPGSGPSSPAPVRFACTGDAEHFRAMASLLMGEDIGPVEAVPPPLWNDHRNASRLSS